MPDPADHNARAIAEDAGQPQPPRRRRDLRRADGALSDAQTGTMPAVTPEPSTTPDRGTPVPRRSSWAEAAAAADQAKPAAHVPAPTRRPAKPPVTPQPAATQPQAHEPQPGQPQSAQPEEDNYLTTAVAYDG